MCMGKIGENDGSKCVKVKMALLCGIFMGERVVECGHSGNSRLAD